MSADVVPLRQPEPFGDFDPSTITQPPAPRQWLVDGFILRGTVALVTGEPGVGKSRMLQQQLTAFALGKPWLGRDLNNGEPTASIGFFFEDPQKELERRQWEINAHYGIQDRPFELGGLFRWNTREGKSKLLIDFERYSDKPIFTNLWHDLCYIVREEGIEIVVIDHVAKAFSGGLPRQVSTVVEECTNLARSMPNGGGCVKLVTHPSAATGSIYSGTKQWLAGPRSAMSLQRHPDFDRRTGAHADERVLSFFKGNYGREADLAIRWEEGVFVCDEPDPVSVITQIDKADLDARILAGIRRARYNGGLIPADEDSRGSIAYRARKFGDDYIGRIPLNGLALAQDRLLSSGRLVRVWLKGRCLLREPDGEKYPGEEEMSEIARTDGSSNRRA